MVEPVSHPRGRGRPRKSRSGNTRAEIAEAASAEFAEKGYDAASIRSIARRAHVDSALVHHYFESKAKLFAEVVQLPVRPEHVVRSAFESPEDRLGESIVRTVLTAWESAQMKSIGVTVVRSAVSESEEGRFIRQFLLRELGRAIAERLRAEGNSDEEAELRASLVLTQMSGVLIMRHVLALEPIASLPIEVLIARIAPAVQGHIDGHSASPPDENPVSPLEGRSAAQHP